MKNPFSKKNNCTQCGSKFSNHEDLVKHVRHEHHKTIVKCQKCGQEFIHEKDKQCHARKPFAAGDRRIQKQKTVHAKNHRKIPIIKSLVFILQIPPKTYFLNRFSKKLKNDSPSNCT